MKLINKDEKKNYFKFKAIIAIISIIILGMIYFIFDNNNKISVIIPTYNRGKLIIKTLESILNQTYKNIEILVIDDNSNDNTKQKINEIPDNRIRYIKLKKRKGASFARNIGIKKAIGKYIAFQDSDEISHIDKLEKQIKNLIINKSDFDFCKIILYIKTIKIIFPNKNQEKSIMNNKILDELCNGNFITTSSILVKRNFIKKYLFDNNFPRLQDYDLVLRMVPNAKVSYTNEILIDQHYQNDSISSSSKNFKKAINLLLKKKYKFNYIQKNNFFKYLKLIQKK